MRSLEENTLSSKSREELIEKAKRFLNDEAAKVRTNNIQSVNKNLAQQLREDAEQILKLKSCLESAREQLKDRNHKIKRLTDSFSWKVSSPIRALRRALFDSSKKKYKSVETKLRELKSPIKAKYHIDSPRSWSRDVPIVTIRGWCLLETNSLIKEVRARIDDRTYLGTYGLDRPDLQSTFPQFPQCVKSGFKIEAQIHPKDFAVTLEVLDTSGTWQIFLVVSLDPKVQARSQGTYEHWVRTQDNYSQTDLIEIANASNALRYRPLISVLMPVYNTDLKWLTQAIDSVRNQTYTHWQLCIADDKSTDPKIKPFLEEIASKDNRITVIFRSENGHISEASNSALELAKGEYTCLFDHDDLLSPIALSCIALELNINPEAEVIYSDEDKVDEQGYRFDPHFKPDWNPDLLTAQNYISHLCVYKTKTLKAHAGFRKGFEGSQDWDLLLRVTETLHASKIKHISRVLYHWRAAEGSTSLHLGEKSYTTDAAEKALLEHFKRTNKKAEIIQVNGGHFRPTHSLPIPAPLVSIIIPTRNAEHLVRVCISSLLARTEYRNYEILLIDNNSDDPGAITYFKELCAEGIRVIPYPHPFNYSAITNFAVKEAKGEILCLLNNDIEVLDNTWLDELVSHASRPEVGAVGARLYYPNMTLQHAGVITGLGGVAGHAFKGFTRTHPGTPQYRPHRLQNLTAVTAACLAIRKEVFLKAKGFDEESLTVAFNDVDFCLKVQALGYQNVYTPYAELIHHESVTRGPEDTPEKVTRFQKEIDAIKSRWGDKLLNDPAYNRNLSLDSEDFALAYPPRNPALLHELGLYKQNKV